MITKLKVQTKESSSRWNYGRVFQFSRGSVAKRSPYKSGIRWPKQQKRRMLTTGLLSKLFTIEGWMTHLRLKWSKCVLSGNVHKLTITDRLDQQQEKLKKLDRSETSQFSVMTLASTVILPAVLVLVVNSAIHALLSACTVLVQISYTRVCYALVSL